MKGKKVQDATEKKTIKSAAALVCHFISSIRGLVYKHDEAHQFTLMLSLFQNMFRFTQRVKKNLQSKTGSAQPHFPLNGCVLQNAN